MSAARSRSPAQAVVSLTALTGQYRPIDAPAVVPHPQAELLIVIADLHFDPSGLGVPKGIPERFGGDLVDLITDEGMQIS